MNEFSANKKLEAVLMDIKEQLNEIGREEVMHYMKEFPRESDYNLVQYGNMLIYYEDIRNMYLAAGYSAKNWSDQKVWDTYKRQVGYVARLIYGKANTGVGAVKESIIVTINEMNSMKHSLNGNPRWQIIGYDENGNWFEGQTAPNGEIGYVLSYMYLWRDVKIDYHVTPTGRVVIDNVTRI